MERSVRSQDYLVLTQNFCSFIFIGTLLIQLPAHSDQTAFNLELSDELLADPFYAHLEHLIETDRHGNIIMTPLPSFSHGQKSYQIAKLMERRGGGGAVSIEVPISTSDGVRHQYLRTPPQFSILHLTLLDSHQSRSDKFP